MQLDGVGVVQLGAWFIELRYFALAGLLLFAAIDDWRRRRISNRLVLLGLALAFIFNLVYPNAIGLWRGMLGMLVGFAMLLPFYLLRGMAAGDVKLMAMVGAFLGPLLTLVAVVMTFLVGGLWAVVLVSCNRSWPQLLANFRQLGRSALAGSKNGGETPVSLELSGPSVGRMPYGVVIAIGTLFTVLVLRGGIVF